MTKKQQREQAHMDRIRAARGLPPQSRDALFERVAAARCYIGTANSEQHRRRLELHGFMAIFHPEISPERVLAMETGQ
jgi:hypothetical protein